MQGANEIMNRLKPCPVQPVVEPFCDTVFDCETSEASFSVYDLNTNTLAQSPYDCNKTYTIRLEWIGCDGERVEGNTVGLNDGTGVANFISSNGTINEYTWTPPQINGPVTFTWGNQIDVDNGDPLCTVTVQVVCEEKLGFPALSGAQPVPQPQQTALPTAGQTINLDNGVILTCVDTPAQHQYATRPAVNVDNTLLMTEDGRIYRIPVPPNTGYVLVGQIQKNSESVWSNTNPDLVYGVNSGTQTIWVCDVSTNPFTTTNTGIPAITIGAGEGNISADDQCIVIQTSSQICVYNLQAPYAQVGCIPPPAGYDNHKISQDGQWVVVDVGGAAILYDRNMQNPQTFVPAGASFGHSVTAVDCNGDQVVVWKNNGAGDSLIATNMATGQNYPVLPAGVTHNCGQMHVGYACGRPGYVYVTTCTNGVEWIGAIPLCPGNTQVEVWSEGYADAWGGGNAGVGIATPSCDGTCIIFTSGDAGGGDKDYKLTCPQ